MQIKIYFFIPAFLFSSLLGGIVFSQPGSYVRPGQLFSIRIEKPADSPLYISLSPTHVRQQGAIIFSAIDRFPGSSMPSDYGRFFRKVQAISSEGQSLAVRRMSTNKWEITKGSDLHQITYEVLLHEQEEVIKDQAATGRRRPGYLSFPGAAILGRLEGHEYGYQRVDINKPEGWQLVSNIESIGESAFAANNFSELVQGQFAMGSTFSINRFSAAEVAHILTVYDDGDILPTAVDSTLQIVSQSANILYKTPPFQNYFAFIELLKTAYSGRNGRSGQAQKLANGLHIIIPRENSSLEYIQDKMLVYYLQSWLSHKRYFKAGVADFYSQRYAYSEWLLEGLSMYYSARLRTQIGAMPIESFLQKIVAWTNDVSRQNTDFARDSQADANSTIHSYPARASRGALLGLLLDVQILYQSRGYKRLDDGLQALEKAFLGSNEKMQITQFPHLVREVTGIEVESFFHTYMESQTDLPIQKAFSILGLQPMWQDTRLVDLIMKQSSETPKQTRQLRNWWLKKIAIK